MCVCVCVCVRGSDTIISTFREDILESRHIGTRRYTNSHADTISQKSARHWIHYVTCLQIQLLRNSTRRYAIHNPCRYNFSKLSMLLNLPLENPREPTFQKSYQMIYTLPRCNTLQHIATHCNTLQYTATHCNTLQYTAIHCHTLQHTATHCNTLQHTATHCNTLPFTAPHTYDTPTLVQFLKNQLCRHFTQVM